MPFSESLLEFVDVTERRKGEAERRRGQEYARELGKEAAAQVRKGTLPAHESPWFLYGVREQVGRIASQQYETFVATQMAQSPVTNGYDQQAFEASLGQWRSEFMQKAFGNQADLAILAGFTPRADQIDANTRARFGAIAADNIETEALENTVTEGRGILQEARRKGAKPAETGRNLSLLLDRNIHVGVDKRAANRAVIGAAAEAALLHEDMGVFDILAHVPTSQGNTLADDPSLPATKAQVAQDIQKRTEARRRWLDWLEGKEREANEREFHSRLNRLATDPEVDQQLVSIEGLIALADATGNPALGGEVPAMWRNRLDTGIPDNPEAYREILLAMRDPDFSEIQLDYALATGNISSKQYVDLGRLLKSRDDMPESYRGMLTTERGLLGNEYAKEGTPSWQDSERVRRRRFAMEQLDIQFYNAWEAGEFAEMGPGEVREWLAKASERILVSLPITDRRTGWLDGHIRNPVVAPPLALRPNADGDVPMSPEFHAMILDQIVADDKGEIQDSFVRQSLAKLTGSTDPVVHYQYLGAYGIAETYKQRKREAEEKERRESMERRIP
jgi:hypothetical protein